MIEGYGVGEGRSAFCGTESSMFAGRPLLFLYARIMRRRCMMVVTAAMRVRVRTRASWLGISVRKVYKRPNDA